MKTVYYFLIIFLLLQSCSVSNIVNKALEKTKIYSDEINYEINLKKDDKQVKLIPLRHLGTPKFYENLKDLLSKYQDSNYVVFYEILKNNNVNEDNLRKFRKITGLKNDLDKKEQIDYKKRLLEQIKKVDSTFYFKREVIPQPTYDILIKNKNNSENVDISIDEFVSEYERLYGKIELDSCDYINNWVNTDCKTKQAKGVDKITIDYRNNHVVNELLVSKNKKIVVLYGEAHIKGIQKELLKHNFKEIPQ